MLNLKLKTIASLVNKDDIVVDIGCDHAYLAIYLKNNNLCQEVYASDVSENVINIAKKNIKDNNLEIKTFLSDGFLQLPNLNIDTAIISGMGTSTILDIIENRPKNIKKMIVSSNNNHFELRKKMTKKGFFVQEEIVIFENGKYYPIMLFELKKVKENQLSLKYGKSKNMEYFNYLLNKEKLILPKIPKKHITSILKHKKNIEELEKILKERS